MMATILFFYFFWRHWALKDHLRHLGKRVWKATAPKDGILAWFFVCPD